MPVFHRHVERLRSVISAHPVAVVILIGIAWILPGAIGHDPWKPDEAYTFGIVYHILQTGDWVIPVLAGEPFMEKPPLYFLTAALFGKIFSPLLPLHDGARLATAAYMGLTLLFVALGGRADAARLYRTGGTRASTSHRHGLADRLRGEPVRARAG